MTDFHYQLDEFYLDLQEDGSRISLLNEDLITKAPFPGLRPFKTSECQLFKGRGGQEEELIKRLNKNHFLAVIGSSGTGKSSLVRAGLLPQLFGGYLHKAGNKWNIAICRPGKDPIANLSIALSSVMGRSKEKNVIEENFDIVEPLLSNSLYGILEVNELLNSQDNDNQPSNLLIIVDQFEELFRFDRKSLGKENIENHFVNLLLKSSLNPSSSVYVIITMRSEFLGDCVKYKGLPEAINDGQYLVPQLNRDQLKEVIEGPIRLAAKKIEPGLVDLLINEIDEGKLKENLDQLPILQHALMRTYNKAVGDEKRNEINFWHYDFIGGMKMALANHAEAKYKELGDSDNNDVSLSRKQKIAKIIFQSLTDLSSGQKGGRRPTELKKIYGIAANIGASESEVDEVINHFRGNDASFIMPPDTSLYPELILDISHESIMRNWQRLHDWIKEEVKNGKLYKTLNERRELREQPGMADEWIRGGLLDEMLIWKKTYPLNSTWASRYSFADSETENHINFNKNIEFLDSSQKQYLLAKRKEDQKKKLIISIFAIATIVSMAFGLWATKETKLARVQKHKADSLASMAVDYAKKIKLEEERTKRADKNTIAALIKAKAADEQKNNAVLIAKKADELKNKASLRAENESKIREIQKQYLDSIQLKVNELTKLVRDNNRLKYRARLIKQPWWNSELDSNLNNNIADTLFNLRYPENGSDPQKNNKANKIEKSLQLIANADSQRREKTDFGLYTYLLSDAKDTSSNLITNYYVDSITKIAIPYQNKFMVQNFSSVRSTGNDQPLLLKLLRKSQTGFVVGNTLGFFQYKLNSDIPVKILDLNENERAVAISDDGVKLLSYNLEEQVFTIYTLLNNSLSSRKYIKIEKSPGQSRKFISQNIKGTFSPDNRFLAIYDGYNIYEICDLTTGFTSKIACENDVQDFTFNKNGKRILICATNAVYWADIENIKKINVKTASFDGSYYNYSRAAKFLKASFINDTSIYVINNRCRYKGSINQSLHLEEYFESSIINYYNVSTDNSDIIVQDYSDGSSNIQVINKKTGITKQFPWHNNTIKAIDAIDNGEIIISGDNEVIYQWNLFNHLDADSLKYYIQNDKIASYYNDLGEFENKNKNYSTAIEYYNKSLATDSNYAKPWYNLGLISTDKHNYRLANIQFKKAVQHDAKNAKYLRSLGNSYFYYIVIDYQSAESVFKLALEVDSNNSDIWNDFGILSFRRGYYEEAIKRLKKALSINKNTAIYVTNLTDAYYNNKQYKAGDSVLNSYLKLDTNSAELWDQLGARNRKLQKYSLAIKAFNTEVKLDSNSFIPWISLAYAYCDTGQFDLALHSIRKACEKADKNSYIFYNDLSIALNRVGKYKDAKAYADSAISLSIEVANPYAHRGFAYLKLGNLHEAMTNFDVALTINPNYAKTYFYFACYYLLIDDKFNSLKYLELAVAKGFDEIKWIENESFLNGIRNENRYRDLISELKARLTR